MSLDHIDKLLKSAFRAEQYAYKVAYWETLASKLPPSQPSNISKFKSALGVFIAALLITNDAEHRVSPILLSDASLASQLVEKNSVINKTSKLTNLSLVKSEKESALNQATTSNTLLADNKSNSRNNQTAIERTNNLSLNNKKSKPTSSDNNSEVLIETIEVGSLSKMRTAMLAGIKNNNSPVELDSPLPDETEFGTKIKKGKTTNLYLQGNAIHLQLSGNDVLPETTPEGFDANYTSHSLSGAELLIGAKRKGVFAFSGVGLSRIAKTYSYQFSISHTETHTQINSNTYLQSVDSTFSHYIIEEENAANTSNFDIAQAVYSVDSNFVTTHDTIVSSSTTNDEKSVALAYNLDYITLPLYIGYEVEHKRFFANVSAGVNVGVLTNYNGFKYNEKHEALRSPVTSSDLNPITLSYTVSIGVGYDITPTIAVNAQPVYSSTLIGSFKNIKPDQVSGFGGKLGLRYQF